MFGSILFGPREVKGAMTGAGFTPRTVSPGRRVAVGFLSVLMYSRITSNSSVVPRRRNRSASLGAKNQICSAKKKEQERKSGSQKIRSVVPRRRNRSASLRAKNQIYSAQKKKQECKHGTQGNADYMDAIGDCLVECFKNVTVEASSFTFVGKLPADLIDCEADEWCPAGGSPIAEPTESGSVSNSPTSNG
nr:hypothetical protein Itr_chr11CG20270 [Ipomoea trifida]